MSIEILTEDEKNIRAEGIAWKKAFCADGNEVLVLLSFNKNDVAGMPLEGDYYVLQCPVTVLAIYDMWGYRTTIEETRSFFNRDFVYKIGKTIKAEKGIWAWPTFNEAVDYWKNEPNMHVRDKRYESLGKKKIYEA